MHLGKHFGRGPLTWEPLRVKGGAEGRGFAALFCVVCGSRGGVVCSDCGRLRSGPETSNASAAQQENSRKGARGGASHRRQGTSRKPLGGEGDQRGIGD